MHDYIINISNVNIVILILLNEIMFYDIKYEHNLY